MYRMLALAAVILSPCLAFSEECAAPTVTVQEQLQLPQFFANRKCDSDADCPGFANSCFAGHCTSSDDTLCDSDKDCPGFANSCFAGHCTSKDTNQCDSDKDCPGFANSCFAGHCTNP